MFVCSLVFINMQDTFPASVYIHIYTQYYKYDNIDVDVESSGLDIGITAQFNRKEALIDIIKLFEVVKKIKKDIASIPEGWYKGRKCPKKSTMSDQFANTYKSHSIEEYKILASNYNNYCYSLLISF